MSRVLTVITGDAPELRQKSKLVENVENPDIQELILDMELTMYKKDGAGLAAPQVGRLLRIIAVADGRQQYVIINPIIVRSSKAVVSMEEGCLSLPGIFGYVERPEKVTVAGLNSAGKPIKIKAAGLLARVLQHEIDHLEGVLFIDKVKKK